MGRCYVCRRLAPLTIQKGVEVCRGCQNAVARVLDLESVESFLVERLILLRDNTNEPITHSRCQSALEQLGSSYLVDHAALSRVLARIVAVLEPTAGKGHALETIKDDHQRTVGSHQPVTYACIMPGCEVCAAVGAAREMLDALTKLPDA